MMTLTRNNLPTKYQSLLALTYKQKLAELLSKLSDNASAEMYDAAEAIAFGKAYGEVRAKVVFDLTGEPSVE